MSGRTPGESRSMGPIALRLLAAACLASPMTAGAAFAQSITVGAGSTLSLSNATVDLGCSDLVVAGTTNLGSAVVSQAVDVSIPTGGTLNGGSSSLAVTGDWSRTGSFNAGTGTVDFGDGCGTSSSTISDSSTFNDLNVTTSSGKQVFFEAGATTTVNGAFTASGAAGNQLLVASTSPGSEAFLSLASAAMGDFVDVTDNHAVAAPVSLAENSSLLGNTPGWSIGALVPAIGLLGLGLLAAGLALSGRRVLR